VSDVEISRNWRIRLSADARPLTETMAGISRIPASDGLCQTPILKRGWQTHGPCVLLWAGVPWMGSCRDLAFLGCNGVVLSGAESRGSFRKKLDIFVTETSAFLPAVARRCGVVRSQSATAK